MSFAQVWEAFYGDRQTSESRVRAERAYKQAIVEGHDLRGLLAHVCSIDNTGRELRPLIVTYVAKLSDRKPPQETANAPKAAPADLHSPTPDRAPEVDPVQRLRALYALWAKRNPRGGFEKVLEAWKARPADLTIEILEDRVRWRLRQFDDDSDDPEKSKHLGALANYIAKGRWRDQPAPPARTNYATMIGDVTNDEYFATSWRAVGHTEEEIAHFLSLSPPERVRFLVQSMY